MSIINDALKKARREGTQASEKPVTEQETSVIQPKVRSGGKTRTRHSVLPVLLLLLLFAGLLSGLGYFLYKEFLHAETPPVASSEKSAASTQTEELALPDPRTGQTQRVTQSDSEPSEESSYSRAEILSQIQINGVMRGGDRPGVITNSGVYREGDPLRQPKGFLLESIGEQNLTLLSPDGHRFQIPLP